MLHLFPRLKFQCIPIALALVLLGSFGATAAANDDGAATPAEAVEKYLEAAKARDVEKVTAVTSPDVVQNPESLKRVLEALTITEFKVGEAVTHEGATFVSYTIQLKFDEAKWVESELAEARAMAKAAGQPLSAEAEADTKSFIAASAAEMKKGLERPNQTATTKQVDNKWFVFEIIGGETAQTALSELDAFVAALKAKDIDTLKKYSAAVPGQAHTVFDAFEVAAFAEAVTVSEMTIETAEGDPDSDSAYFMVRLKFTVTGLEALVDKTVAAQTAAAQAHGKPLSDEDIAAIKEGLKELCGQLEKCADGAAPIEIMVYKTDSGWQIELSFPE